MFYNRIVEELESKLADLTTAQKQFIVYLCLTKNKADALSMSGHDIRSLQRWAKQPEFLHLMQVAVDTPRGTALAFLWGDKLPTVLESIGSILSWNPSELEGQQIRLWQWAVELLFRVLGESGGAAPKQVQNNFWNVIQQVRKVGFNVEEGRVVDTSLLPGNTGDNYSADDTNKGDVGSPGGAGLDGPGSTERAQD